MRGSACCAESARPKSKYTLAGFAGFFASLFAAADMGRPSSAGLHGRQPGQDGVRKVYCTLDTATGMHAPAPIFCLLQVRECRMPQLDFEGHWSLRTLAGAALCPEDAAAAAAVNRFLAEELARTCCYNKSHACFTADLKRIQVQPARDRCHQEGTPGL